MDGRNARILYALSVFLLIALPIIVNAADSTNPADYRVYDDAESGTPASNGWYTRAGTSSGTYDDTHALNGTYSLKISGNGKYSRNISGTIDNVTADYWFRDQGGEFQYSGIGQTEGAGTVHLACFGNAYVADPNHYNFGDGVNTIATSVSRSIGWHHVIIYYPNSTWAIGYIDGILGYNSTISTPDMYLDVYVIGGELGYLDNVRVYNGTTPPQEAEGEEASTNVPTWTIPTPENDSYNNTQVTLNATGCNSSERYTIYFGTSANPTTKVVTNSTTHSYTTNSTSGTYYYKAQCWSSEANYSENTTTRVWHFDDDPIITIAVLSANTSSLNLSRGDTAKLRFNITFTDDFDITENITFALYYNGSFHSNGSATAIDNGTNANIANYTVNRTGTYYVIVNVTGSTNGFATETSNTLTISPVNAPAAPTPIGNNMALTITITVLGLVLLLGALYGFMPEALKETTKYAFIALISLIIIVSLLALL